MWKLRCTMTRLCINVFIVSPKTKPTPDILLESYPFFVVGRVKTWGFPRFDCCCCCCQKHLLNAWRWLKGRNWWWVSEAKAANDTLYYVFLFLHFQCIKMLTGDLYVGIRVGRGLKRGRGCGWWSDGLVSRLSRERTHCTFAFPHGVWCGWIMGGLRVSLVWNEKWWVSFAVKTFPLQPDKTPVRFTLYVYTHFYLYLTIDNNSLHRQLCSRQRSMNGEWVSAIVTCASRLDRGPNTQNLLYQCQGHANKYIWAYICNN